MKFLVTGASGFIGGHLCRHLLHVGHAVRAACSAPEKADVLRAMRTEMSALELFRVDHENGITAQWQTACTGIDGVIHLAARAHREKSSEAAAFAYRRVNQELTRVTEAAVWANVKSFVFVSSATVYGTDSPVGQVFRENSPAAPHSDDPYAVAKLEAENFLRTPGIMAALHPVIVRPPLVYGPGVKGNMLSLLRLVARGLPLPLASVNNRRSFVGIDNLVDFLLCAATHESARGKTLLVSDGEDVSTPQLIRAIARGLGKSPRLFSAPPVLLRTAAALSGQRTRYGKLADNFQLDAGWSRELLDWQPKTGFAEGIAEMCAAYKKGQQAINP
ncbi:MAG: NAD-dependent epimerase/dehydratase family protein [Zoogloeaceae bacterium]|jgi:nucleoside-diphosphate-sugar epimerase|nr:NAD-dependent epimerase/dehydratase family protein [Zoogloeaceae bacterium]